MKKNFRRGLAVLALAAAGAGAAAVPAHASPTGPGQFTALAETRNVLVTPAHLHVNEVIHLGLDGPAYTVQTESFNGGGTVFTVSPSLPAADVNQFLLFTF